MERQSVSPETPAAQGLGEEDPVSGGLVPVINPSTNYEQQPDGSAAVNATGFLGTWDLPWLSGVVGGLFTHKIMIIGSAIRAALAVTERN